MICNKFHNITENTKKLKLNNLNNWGFSDQFPS